MTLRRTFIVGVCCSLLVYLPMGYLLVEYYDADISPPATVSTTYYVGARKAFKPGDQWVYRGRTFIKRDCILRVDTLYREVKTNVVFRLTSRFGVNSGTGGRIKGRWIDRNYVRQIPDLSPGIYGVATELIYSCGRARPYRLRTNELQITVLPMN